MYYPARGREPPFTSLSGAFNAVKECIIPQGDENLFSGRLVSVYFLRLRNVLPRKGTRTYCLSCSLRDNHRVKKCIAPKGDENAFATLSV